MQGPVGFESLAQGVLRPNLIMAAALIVSVLASGCSSFSVSREMVVPPEVKALHGRRPVFVGNFNGARGAHARDLVLRALTAVDYHRIQAGPTADAVFVQGGVSDDVYEDQTKEGLETRCAERDKKGKCTRETKVRVFERKQLCQVEFKITAVDRTDGRVVYTRAQPWGRELTKRYDDGAERPPQVREALCESAVDYAVAAAVEKIAATLDDFDLDFHPVEGDGGDTERAVKLVKQGRLNDAEGLLAPLRTSQDLGPEDRDWSKYNLALVYFASERFDECIGSLDGMKGSTRESKDVGRLRQSCIDFK